MNIPLLHLAETAFTAERLTAFVEGLLIVYDEGKQIIHVGWIKTAARQGNSLMLTLEPCIWRKSGNTKWADLTQHTFIVNLTNYFALDIGANGFRCTTELGPPF